MKKFSKILVVVLGLYLIFNLSRSVWDLWQRQERLEKARQTLEREKRRYEELGLKSEYVQKPEYVEKEARDKLLLTRPGEKTVLINEELFRELEATKSAEIVDTRPNWKKWLEIFF